MNETHKRKVHFDGMGGGWNDVDEFFSLPFIMSVQVVFLLTPEM